MYKNMSTEEKKPKQRMFIYSLLDLPFLILCKLDIYNFLLLK